MSKIHDTSELEHTISTMERNIWKIKKGKDIDKNVNIVNRKLHSIRNYYITTELTDYESKYVFSGFFGEYGINKDTFKEKDYVFDKEKLKQIQNF